MHTRSLRTLASISIGAALLAACAVTPPQTTAPTAAPAAPAATSAPAATAASGAAPTSAPAASAPTDAEIKAGIQQALDLYARAYNEGNADLLKQAADQTNAPFRRFIQTRFDTFQESIRSGQKRSYKVGDIKQRDLGFVQAQVETGGFVYDWTFRQVKGQWVMSEPKEDQLGKREKSETEHFVFYTYPWADDVNGKIKEIMEQARANVLKKLGKAPDSKPSVYIRPIFGVGGPENPNTLAYYDRNNRGGDRIIIYAPQSYVFGAYDPATGWEPELEGTLTHEYTHLVNQRSFTPIARMTDWMVEGLAEYVSDPNSARDRGVGLAVQSDQIIPIMDTSGAVNKQDLNHLTILDKNVSLAYGLGASLVDYINQTYGGMDGFWKFANAYDKTQDMDKALQQAFGVSYEQFDQDWRAWLKQNYS